MLYALRRLVIQEPLEETLSRVCYLAKNCHEVSHLMHGPNARNPTAGTCLFVG